MVMKAKDIMDKSFIVLDERTSALDAVKKMVQERHGFVIVSREGKAVGVVTEWDYLEKIVSKEVDPSKVTLSEIMSSPIVSCEKDTPTEEAVEIMVKKGIRRLIVKGNDKVVGVITSRTVLEIFKRYVDEIAAIVARFSVTPF
ncbi:hypothetical protein B9Q02_08505 [Candidatus Marsarchaeota G1 archaeon BE_D]|uniref:CBS domain-containing protein n=1 Tax=Candidatus Marsarchaeota G1 archaeon BE_D TaxID=1978156 RepID=A0A2R6AEW5_9ARCH|nr:MAG: hypothetical protein B9Q02_08505 [Candidatus Marsarchaeota G1 archaeon BE_D]